MEFQDELKKLGERITELKNNIETEEATKNALIMPFIKILGYDVFNPSEVKPEYTADVGTKKEEKVDYAIFQNDSPIILIECKPWWEKLDCHMSQLVRYFQNTSTKIGILTNGLKYRFYTDINNTNLMDSDTFLEFDIENIKENDVNELKKFKKELFNNDKIRSDAKILKRSTSVKNLLLRELSDPSEEFIKFIIKQISNIRMTPKAIKEFSEIVKKVTNQTFNDIVNDRLMSALSKENSINEEELEEEPQKENKIVTTTEELEGYNIVRAIIRKEIDIKRIEMRDTMSYFGILIDDNRLKKVCNLHFNGSKKYIGLFDGEKEEKILLNSLDDIFNYEDRLLKTVLKYN